MTQQIPAEERFHNDYYYFMHSLRVLAQDAKVQCAIGDNFNVAWELQHDLLGGASGVLNYPDGGLTAAQRTLIEQLVKTLEEIPASAISGSRTAEGSLKDMSHPCWAPLRKTAAALIECLEPITERNRAYFHASKP